MKKKVLTFLIAAAMLSTTLTGCGGNTTNNNTESGINSTVSGETEQSGETAYEYEYRDLPAPVYMEAATAFAGGSGTEADPYQISNAAELAYLGKVIGGTTYADACYVLTADIALNDLADFDNWATKAPAYSWQPIKATGKSFVFDGAGHTVSGMYINTNCDDEQGKYGLFEDCRGVIKNLSVDKSYIAVSGKSADVGGIAGALFDSGKIENCTVNAAMDCYDGNYGGIVGSPMGGMVVGDDSPAGYSTITGCIFKGVITQKKAGSISMLGGIAGGGDGNIEACVNNGTINFGSDNVDSVGGIIGFWGDGVIDSCENKGSLNGALDEEGGMARAGGIVGNLFLSNTGSEKYMSRGATVKNCKNSGTVSGNYAAGGIVGNANNDLNDYCLTVSGCENNGTVKSIEYTGGIIGRLYCKGDYQKTENVVIESCTNKASLDTGVTGGIIGLFYTTKGKAVVRDCINNGAVSTKGQHSAGIIAYWLMDSKPEIDATVENCKNNASVHSALNAGGIICYADSPVLSEDVKSSKINISGCENLGEITTDADNSYIGGIIGAWGMEKIATTITNCQNSGMLSILNDAPDEETLNSDKTFTLSRIAGGIIGRLGPGMLLTTDSDKGSDDNIQKASAVITITACSGTGTLTVNYDEEYTNKNGQKLYQNYFGGIIGNACAEDGFSVFTDNCEYTGFERGLGNKDLSDIGTGK